MVDARFPEKWLTDRRLMRLSTSAFRSFSTALIWSVSNQTEGVIHSEDWPTIPAFMPIDVAELVSSGLWAEIEGGWEIAVFAGTQTTRDELMVLERVRRDWRTQKARRRLAVKEGVDSVPVDMSTRTAQARPSLKDQEEEPPLFCPQHPAGADGPCLPCGDARRLHSAWTRAHSVKATTSTPKRADPATCDHRLHPVDPVCLTCDTVFATDDAIYVELRLAQLEVSRGRR
ncbi:MAG: hypothetical protein ABIP33_06305 [Pseudolysinimonas sp.]